MAFPIIPKLNSAPGAGAPATLTLGELAANRSTAKLYLGTDTGVQELAFTGSLGGTAVSTFTAAGGTSFSPLNGYTTINVTAYLVSVGGIEQRPTVDWTISSAGGGTVVFAAAPPSGATIVVRAVVAGAGGGSGGADIGGRAWSSAATYTEGDLVATDQTSAWICIQSDNTNHEPSASPTWWARMPASAVQLQFRPLAETAPTDGQAIVWDDANTTWKPGTVSGGGGNATQLQSRDIATTAPTNGQVLAWNATTSKWEPTGGGGTITFNTVGTHYWTAPFFARYVRVQLTSGTGASGTNGTDGTMGTDGGTIDIDGVVTPYAGDDGADGVDGTNGASGKSASFAGLTATGGAGGTKGLKGLKGGGGGAPGDFSLTISATAGSNGGSGVGGGGAYVDYLGGHGGTGAVSGDCIATDGNTSGGGMGACNGRSGGGFNFTGGLGGGGSVGTGGSGGGMSQNGFGQGGGGGNPTTRTSGTAGANGANIDQSYLVTALSQYSIVITEGAGTASCTITW